MGLLMLLVLLRCNSLHIMVWSRTHTHTQHRHMQRLSSGVQAAGMCRYGAASREKLLLFPGVARHVRWTHAGLLRCL